MPTQDYQDRKALRGLSFEQWEYDARLLVGALTIERLLAKGWIERLPDWPDQKKCRITDAGRTALAELNAPKPRTSPRKSMKMLKPTMRMADLSIAKVRP